MIVYRGWFFNDLVFVILLATAWNLLRIIHFFLPALASVIKDFSKILFQQFINICTRDSYHLFVIYVLPVSFGELIIIFAKSEDLLKK